MTVGFSNVPITLRRDENPSRRSVMSTVIDAPVLTSLDNGHREGILGRADVSKSGGNAGWPASTGFRSPARRLRQGVEPFRCQGGG